MLLPHVIKPSCTEYLLHCCKMAAIASSPKSRVSAVQLSGRLTNCWSLDVNWDLIPPMLREVS